MRKLLIYILCLLPISYIGLAQDSKEEKYSELVNRYFNYFEQEMPDSAEVVLRKAIDLMPEAEGNFLLRGNLAELMVARADTLGAIEQLSLALGQQPSVVQLRSRRAELLEQQNKLNDALLDLDILVEQKPTWEIPLYNRARVKRKLGLLDGAQIDLERIIKMNNEAYLPRIALAQVHELQGEQMEAERILTYLIDKYSKTPNAYRERARLYMRQGRKSDALKDIRYIFNDLKIETAEDYRIRGEIWMLYGEKEQAKKDIKMAESLESKAENRKEIS